MSKSKNILGDSPAVKSLLQLIAKVANAKTSVLIIGESGTGKELVARMIHDTSPLKDKPFIPVNCGAIPENLIESEMFGHKRGSFTGAVSDKVGLFEAANGGTLFLDEVGELPLGLQVKLLRALQERVIRRVGGNDDIKIDTRVIAATNRDLEIAIGQNTFREDLYYRLNVIQIRTPPLRERGTDIKLLAEHFRKTYSAKQSKDISGFDPAAVSALEAYRWPGNIRELENTIERAVTLSSGGKITLHCLPAQIAALYGEEPAPAAAETKSGKKAGKGSAAAEAASTVPGEIRLPPPDFSKGKIDLDEILGEVEKVYLLAAVGQAGGVKKKAADLLGITFRSIRYRIKKLGLKIKE